MVSGLLRLSSLTATQTHSLAGRGTGLSVLLDTSSLKPGAMSYVQGAESSNPSTQKPGAVAM